MLPANHTYASDIDVHRELFLWMNTCSTEGGSSNLFQLLLTSGIKLDDQQLVQKRKNVAEKLALHKGLLRRFESLKLSEDFLKSYYKMLDNKEAEIQEKSLTSSTLIYAFLSFFVWGFLLIPPLSLFIKTKNYDAFLQPLFIYAIFVLFGVYVFQPLMNKALWIAKNTKYIELIMNNLALTARKKLGINLELPYSFLNSRAAKEIRLMNFFIDILSLRGNPVFWILIHVFFPFDAVFSLLLFFLIKKISIHLPVWQEEINEFDLLMSFARLKVENPEFNFIEYKEENEVNKIQVIEMGHPLLPYHKRICNSVSLDKNAPLVLLTGSNMSGKSTFLRTFATNILLSNMGAPVCAKEFLLPQTHILCAIRIDDSLTEGTSYFYAEVKRLAEILRQLKKLKQNALFFIDEIFKGTNNKERYLGSLSILKALLESQAFGFVSTHDLALTDVAENEPRLRNMHFREHIQDDKLTFDYTLKEGPCPTTNALFIMKIAGLPV